MTIGGRCEFIRFRSCSGCILVYLTIYLSGLFARVCREARYSHFTQDVEQRAKLGKAGLEKVQPHKAGEPEPVW